MTDQEHADEIERCRAALQTATDAACEAGLALDIDAQAVRTINDVGQWRIRIAVSRPLRVIKPSR